MAMAGLVVSAAATAALGMLVLVESLVVELTLAWLSRCVPFAVLASTVAVMTIVWLAVAASLLKVVEPVHVALALPDTLTVALYTLSLHVALPISDCASDGPLLVTMRV